MDWSGLLNDKNFINMLARTGSALGGKGSVGQAVGDAALLFNQDKAAQEAVGKQNTSQDSRWQQFMDLLSGKASDPNNTAVKSISVDDTGATVKLNGPTNNINGSEYGMNPSQIATQAMTKPVTPQSNTQKINQEYGLKMSDIFPLNRAR